VVFGEGIPWEVIVTDLRRRTAEHEYIREAEALLRGGLPRLSALTAALLERAEAEARGRDDNHVGTEHLVLGLYAVGETTARRVLESLGIRREIFAGQLECEAGPSPSGAIPLTPRARMILGLAGKAGAIYRLDVNVRGAPSGWFWN
jgi:hypothetical protein